MVDVGNNCDVSDTLHEIFACEKVCKGTVYLQRIYIYRILVGSKQLSEKELIFQCFKERRQKSAQMTNSVESSNK